MKLTVKQPVEIEVDAVRVVVPVRYDEEDISNSFPLRSGKLWAATIDLATGKIREWPKDAGAQSLNIKVVDEGCYYLMSGEKVVASREQDYVPEFFPGDHYGDYICFEIGADGVIEDWDAEVDEVVDAFFTGEETGGCP